MLDASGSVESNYALIQDLAKRVVYGLNFNAGRTRVGVITYQNTEQIRFHLNEYTSQDEVLNAIAFDKNSSDGTHTSSALRIMREQMFKARKGDRTGVDNVALVLTDGRSNIQNSNTIPEADLAKDDDIHMMAVGVGRRVGHNEINGIASSPTSDNAFFLDDASELDNVANLILDQLCEF